MNNEHNRERNNARPARMTTLSLALALMAAGFVAILAGGRTHASSGTAFHDEEMTLALPGQSGYVRVNTLLVDDGQRPLEDVIAEVREETLAGFPGAVEVHQGQVTAAFVTFTSWNPPQASWLYNDENKPDDLSGEGSVLVNAANAWNGVGGSPWSFSGGGSTTLDPNPCQNGGGDGTSVVGWSEDKLGKTTLAQTCTWFSEYAHEFDMVLSNGWDWTIGDPASTDLFTVAMHEFGHALGLRHTQLAHCPSSVMCSRYVEGTVKDAPQPDDIDGVVELYGGDGPPPSPTNTPTATPTPTETVTPPVEEPMTSQTLPGIARD